ncbi:hypothetical protein NLM33_05450 [Bradyrhizobium sp. CCGUVB1N3]|uniref:hypothetical protein n=1 Tax=Bradyrhizobium sp. CCGUVB1N3 TaxID=2949629 RepID=UPI0020B28B57|nr:hypothetical protein [Bradyrhizobium sp. CCGUVB1N3]MCP3469774.1 hypothetical protein [Bradyrhizobium sp. CCGUVB1N3]
MKMPTVGWAFFGLAVFVLISYVLSLGIFVGSTTRFNPRDGDERSYHSYHCQYLYLSGVRTTFGHGTGSTPEEATEVGFCPTFGPKD